VRSNRTHLPDLAKLSGMSTIPGGACGYVRSLPIAATDPPVCGSAQVRRYFWTIEARPPRRPTDRALGTGDRAGASRAALPIRRKINGR